MGKTYPHGPMDPWTHGLIDREPSMNQRAFLEQTARRAMREHGLEPDFAEAALAQAAQASIAGADGLRDLRSLPWSSIDNDESRDLDQLEVIESSTHDVARVLVAIADVDALV